MEAAAGHELDDDRPRARATRSSSETDGNPFFVGEMLRHLAETGAIYQDDDGRWSLRGRWPSSGCRRACAR